MRRTSSVAESRPFQAVVGHESEEKLLLYTSICLVVFLEKNLVACIVLTLEVYDCLQKPVSLDSHILEVGLSSQAHEVGFAHLGSLSLVHSGLRWHESEANQLLSV